MYVADVPQPTQGVLNTTCALYCLCHLWLIFKSSLHYLEPFPPDDVYFRDYQILLFAFTMKVTPGQLSGNERISDFYNEMIRVKVAQDKPGAWPVADEW